MLRALELIRNPCTLFTSGDVNSQGQFMNRFMYRFAGIIERTQCVREGVHGGVTMETLPDRAPVENYPNPIPEENATQLSPRYCIVFVLYLFKRILQKQMDAYHGSLPHKYRKKKMGKWGRGEWKMKHGMKGNKYLNIEV